MEHDVVTPHDALDPQIRLFVTRVAESFARYPSFDRLSHAEVRRVAEEVRAPWRRGGPKMHGTVEHDVPVEGGTVRIRVYDPGAAGVKPALIYLHGGGWTMFSLDTHDRVMREYAARASVLVIGVDYPLSPEAKFPRALEQIAEVVLWLGEHGHDLGVDPTRLAIGGDSAGGNLAVATCLKLRDGAETQRLKAMLLNYGGFDPKCSDDAARKFGGEGFMLTRQELQTFWGNYTRGPQDANNPLAAPLRARLEGLPPAFLTIPECDILTEQSLAMAQKLREANVPVRAEIYAGATHSFLEAVSVAAVADRALWDGAQWLRATLAQPRSI